MRSAPRRRQADPARPFDAASSWAEQAFGDPPTYLFPVTTIAASHALAGHKDEARRAMQHLHRLDPTLRTSNLKDWIPLHRPEDLVMFADGLRTAGLPE